MTAARVLVAATLMALSLGFARALESYSSLSSKLNSIAKLGGDVTLLTRT